MKKIYSLLLLLMAGLTQVTHAQTSCSTPYQLYYGSSYTAPLITGTPNIDTTNDYGCLSGAPNVSWFVLRVCNPGSFTITLHVYTMSSSADVSFVAWGPLTSPTGCGLDSSQIIDCDNSTAATKYLVLDSTAVGEYYKFMVSNTSDSAGTYMITQSPGSGYACPSGACPGTLPPQSICEVSTDPLTNRNTIIWNKDTAYTGSYIIQKESTTLGIYTTIATLANNDTSVYVDSVSNPMIQAFRYRIVTTDTCGNLLPGTGHQTIHLLTSTSSSTGYPQLSWSSYGGLSYGTYFIYRGASPSTLTLYDSISAAFLMYTDVNPASGLVYYSIAIVPPIPCHPSRDIEMAYSNVAAAVFTGITENSFSDLVISPNPASDELNFSTENNHFNSIEFEIYDVTGRKLIGQLYKNTSQAKIDISNLANGYYVVRFVTDKGATQRTIIVAR